MRKFLIPLMLASVALPATSIAGDEDRDARRAARAEQRADRPERDERVDRPARVEAQQQQQQQVPREMRMERSNRGPGPQMQVDRQQRQIERQQQQQQQRGPDRAQRDWNDGNAGQQPAIQQGDLVREHRNRGPRVSTTDGLPNNIRQDRSERAQRPDRIDRVQRIDRIQERELARRSRMPGLPPAVTPGSGPRTPGGGLVSTPLPGGGELRHSSSGAQWATHWRNDRRYDWRNWRHRHRISFHIGLYSDPYGFGYQRMGYGWQLFPSYYRSSYWLNDPWQYRLPPAYGPYRWVRYWDDALLVDTYSGEVVDVIHDFFW